jgi:hypothetical protein
MEQKIKTRIEAIVSKSTRKDGTKYVDKNGKPFDVVSIKVDESIINDSTFNGWISTIDYTGEYATIREGETLEGYLSSRVVDDKTFWNFRKPSRLDELEERIARLEDLHDGQEPAGTQETEEDEEEVGYDDLPF